MLTRSYIYGNPRKPGLVNFCFSLLCAELRAHFEPTSETEGADKDADEMEEYQQVEQKRHEAPVVTSGVCTLTSAAFLDTHQQQLSLQLGKLKQETNR